MRSTVLLLLFSTLLAFGQPNRTPQGPFGFYMGMSKEAVISVVGRGAIDKEKGDMLYVSTAPKPHGAFELYGLTFGRDGLLRVAALGKDIKTNGFGDNVRFDFEDLLKPLTALYGSPHRLDFLRPGSIWREGEDWMMGILKEERILAAYWLKSRGVNLPNSIRDISFQARAASTSLGYVALTYEFDGYGAYMTQKKASEGTVF